jgi:hypothetical protein
MTERQVEPMLASLRGSLAAHRNASDLQAAKAAFSVIRSFLNTTLLRLFQMCQQHNSRNVLKYFPGM